MLDNLPSYISLVFGLTTVATLGLFFWVLKNSNSEVTRKNSVKITFILVVWLLVQAIVTLTGVYNSDVNSIPPKIFIFGIMPVVLLFIVLFSTHTGRESIDGLSLPHLTFLNIVRIPVELVLLWLFLNKAVPELMTCEGRNFDIISGITAPLVAYFGFEKKKLSRTALLAWNFLCLGLLINIVVIAFLSAPSPLQRIAFDQPNVAILNFPFNWLPTFIVPIVLLGHLASIRQLIVMK